MNSNFVNVNDNNLYRMGMNPNLMGMNTQFSNMNTNVNNNNLLTEQTLQKYNVIPNAGLQSSHINRPYRLSLSFDVTDVSSPIILNETFKDVVSVKLLNAILIISAPLDSSTADSLSIPTYITLSIKELNNIYSTSTPSGLSLLNSFSSLYFESNYNREQDGTDEKVNIYKSKFEDNQDIKYFDPPLNSLGQLNISLFSDNTTNTIAGSYKCKLDFIVETKEKMRVY